MLGIKHAPKPEIYVTESDRKALQQLASAAMSAPEVADDLLNELDRARTAAEDGPRRHIGIGTRATFRTSAGDERTVQLVMPPDADISSGRISILTPVGVALLGLSEGQSIDWTARDGRKGTLTVTRVFQETAATPGP